MKSLWMLGAALFLALLAACVKLAAQQGIPMGQIVFFRALVSLLALYSFMRWRGFAIATPLWKQQLYRSIPGVGSLLTYFFALKLLPLATAVTLNYTTPFFLALLLMLGKQQPIRPMPIAALVAGFFGAMLLLQPSFNAAEWLGCLLAIASALFAALYLVGIRRMGELGEPTLRTVLYYALLCTIVALPWFVFSVAETAIRGSSWIYLLAAGVFGTLGQVMMTLAFQQGRPLVSASLGYSQVAFSCLLGIWIWQDALPSHVWLGMLLIACSGILTSVTTQK